MRWVVYFLCCGQGSSKPNVSQVNFPVMQWVCIQFMATCKNRYAVREKLVCVCNDSFLLHFCGLLLPRGTLYRFLYVCVCECVWIWGSECARAFVFSPCLLVCELMYGTYDWETEWSFGCQGVVCVWVCMWEARSLYGHVCMLQNVHSCDNCLRKPCSPLVLCDLTTMNCGSLR